MASSRTSRTPTLGPSRAPTIIAVAVVVVLIAVIGTFLYIQANRPAETPELAAASASYPTTVTEGVVVGGTGPRVIDVYEDALCPACQQFESRYGDRIATAVAAGRVQARYHMVNLLEESSNPPGYSTLAGNALICSAETAAFPTLHSTLYARQPSEGGAGYTAEQLVTLGQQAGAGPGYAECVTSGRHAAEVTANLRAASSDPALQQEVRGRTGFGTPTVQVDGRTVSQDSPELLAALG